MTPPPQRGFRPEVSEKLDEMVRWIRERDPWLARRVEELSFEPSRKVSIFGSDEPGHMGVNPAAVQALTVKQLAGGLAATLLASAALRHASRSRRQMLRVHVVSLRERVRGEGGP